MKLDSKDIGNLFLVILLLLLMFCCGCTPQQRLNHLLDRHPYLAQKDTVKFTDTFEIEVPGVKVDSSIFIDDARNDTIVIRKENMTIKTYYNRDTIYVSGECDTIRETRVVEKAIPYEKFIYKKPRDALTWYHWLAISLGIIGLIILFVFLISLMRRRE
jgi:hypothetical protein